MGKVSAMDLHPNVRRVGYLIGTWTGPGRGYYPTIEEFSYEETVTFSALPGKPFLRYEQRTRGATGPLHTELGFLRPVGEKEVEFVLAQPTGQTELLTGVSTADGLDFGDSRIVTSPTAKQVDATRRTYRLDAKGTTLDTAFFMGAVGQPVQQHLESTLRRRDG